MSKKGLGRGLSALLAEQNETATPAQAAAQSEAAGGKNDNVTSLEAGQRNLLPVESINPSKIQPRKYFNEDSLSELAESIRKNGVVQPIIVRRSGEKNFEIVAGERRWRASKMAGITTIPAIIMQLDDRQVLEIALVENIQRKDLSPIEVANGYQRLIDEFNYKQDELAEVVGKSRSQISNSLRLITLPEMVKDLLNEDRITVGHARALRGANEPETIAEQILRKDLNVRQTELLVQKYAEFPRQQEKSRKKQQKDKDVIELEKLVSQSLGMRVTISNEGDKGRLTIEYPSLPELDRLLRLLEGESAAKKLVTEAIS